MTNAADNKPDRPPTPSGVRPAVYGRNYSYFSHRVFVAFMPEDLHKYLYDCLSLVPVSAYTAPSGTAPEQESDAIDIHLVRWVLLHKSELNALALNRELENWRVADDLMDLPASPGVRSDDAYRLEITLQFAVELELAAARNSPLLRKRPRLLLALLDAAYFISRHRGLGRLEDDTPGKPSADIDLSKETGRAAFQAYLIQRMNLDEDKVVAPGAAARPLVGSDAISSAPGGPLSAKEVTWLQSVAIGVARWLSAPQDWSVLKSRWDAVAEVAWTARGLPKPDTTLFDALLVGDQSPLIALPEVGAENEQAPALKDVESFRYRWRPLPSDEAPWARSLKSISDYSKPDRDFIEHVDALLRGAMFGARSSVQVASDPEAQALRLMADRYLVLPTTPAWSAVRDASVRLREAGDGFGNTSDLIRDANLLQPYAAMLRGKDTAAALTLFLVAGAALAGLRAGSRPASPGQAAAVRPSAEDWTIALTAVCDGLRLDDLGVAPSASRLRGLLLDLQGELPMVPVSFFDKQGAAPVGDDLSLTSDPLSDAWLLPGILDETLAAAFGAGLAMAAKKVDHADLVVRAWRSLVARLQRLSAGQDGSVAATASEQMCAMLEIGPGKPGNKLPMRLADANLRQWTDALLAACTDWRNRTADGPPPNVPLALAAHALERLGIRALGTNIQYMVLQELLQSDDGRRELLNYVSKYSLWGSDGSSQRLALVLGPLHTAMAMKWPVPPTGGLVLSCGESGVARLKALGLEVLAKSLPEPMRVAFEPWLMRQSEGEQFISWATSLLKSQPRSNLWLYRKGDVVMRSPSLVDPQTADDLWSSGSSLMPVP